MYADELLLPWLQALVDELPGVRLFDAHTHLGANDPEGWTCSSDELIDALALAGARGVVFPLMEIARRTMRCSPLRTRRRVGLCRSVA